MPVFLSKPKSNVDINRTIRGRKAHLESDSIKEESRIHNFERSIPDFAPRKKNDRNYIPRNKELFHKLLKYLSFKNKLNFRRLKTISNLKKLIIALSKVKMNNPKRLKYFNQNEKIVGLKYPSRMLTPNNRASSKNNAHSLNSKFYPQIFSPYPKQQLSLPFHINRHNNIDNFSHKLNSKRFNILMNKLMYDHHFF